MSTQKLWVIKKLSAMRSAHTEWHDNDGLLGFSSAKNWCEVQGTERKLIIFTKTTLPTVLVYITLGR